MENKVSKVLIQLCDFMIKTRMNICVNEPLTYHIFVLVLIINSLLFDQFHRKQDIIFYVRLYLQ